MNTYHEVLAHHVERLRDNLRNDYASGAVDALLIIGRTDAEAEELRKQLLAGELKATEVTRPWLLRVGASRQRS